MSTVFETTAYQDRLGIVRIEEWPEGLVLWCGGEIMWRSWGPKARPPAPPKRPRKPGYNYPEALVQSIREMAAAGRVLKSIALETGVPRTTVQRICEDIDKPIDHRGRKGSRRRLLGGDE